MITLASHRDLTREAVEAVAWGGEPLSLAPAALEQVASGQAGLAALLASGARVYGVTTGAGWLARSTWSGGPGGAPRNLLLAWRRGPWRPRRGAALLLPGWDLLSVHAGSPRSCAVPVRPVTTVRAAVRGGGGLARD